MKTRVKAAIILSQRESQVLANVLARKKGSVNIAAQSATTEHERKEEDKVVDDFLKRTGEINSLRFG